MFDTEMLRAIILGIVQGITEFLPISSDGHLVIVTALLERWLGVASQQDKSDLHFDVVLHIGTLGSIVVVYWRELWALRLNWRLCGLIVLATIPAGVAGLTLKSVVKEAFDSPLIAGIGLLITAAILLIGQKFAREGRSLDAMTHRDALAIGFLQALAIAPGVSRSGTTISAGLMTGLRRDTAATFSFLIAVPVIAGAVLVTLKDVFAGEESAGRFDVLCVGTAVSFVVGWAALRGLLAVLARGKFHWFAYYCIVVGTAVIAWQSFN